MAKITNYQRNANQRYNEVPSHTGQNGHHVKSTNNKYAGEDVGKETLPTPLVGK